MRVPHTKTKENILLRFKLKAFMEKRGLGQKDVAAWTGLSQTNISFILSGERFASEKVLKKMQEMFEFFQA